MESKFLGKLCDVLVIWFIKNKDVNGGNLFWNILGKYKESWIKL